MKDLKTFFKDRDESGPAIDVDIAKSINSGLRSLGQTEEVKKLKEKYKKPSNVENLQVPKVDSVVWRNISDKGKAVDAVIQKIVAKFLPGMSAVIQQFALLHKHKKEIKKSPLLKEIRRLTTDAVLPLSHAVSASCQQRKDAIKPDLDTKFHVLCEPSQPMSATHLFGDNLNARLKELGDTKMFSLSKKTYSYRKDNKQRYRSVNQEDLQRGYSKNHKPQYSNSRKGNQSTNQKRNQKGKWAQKHQ